MKKILPYIIILAGLTGLSCQKEVTTSPEEVLIPKTLLFINSQPQGSKIFIDGRYMGQRTPDTIKWLEKGNHLVTLKTTLLKDSSILVKINGDTTLNFDYYSNPTMYGNMFCDSNPPGAEIYITIGDSDSLFGITPKLIRSLFPAQYNITYKLSGKWDSYSKATVVSERTVTVDENLVDSTVWVNLNSSNIGLPTDWFNDIDIQDGYIKWLASEDKGLIKYVSGPEWTIYNTDNSTIPSNNVKSVRVSDNGIWIGTDNGAALLSNDNFTVYNSSNSPLPDTIDCVFPVPGGKVWIGTVKNGLFYFDGAVWTAYNKTNSPIKSNSVASVFVDHNGIIWIGTVGDGLLVFDLTNWSRVFNALPSPKVDAIEVRGSDIWVGTSLFTGYSYGSGVPPAPPGPKPIYYSGGLALLSGTWTKYKEAGKEIIALRTDSEGNLWFSDYSIGLGKKTSAGFERYNLYNKINGIAIDGAGHKWMSTASRGIVKYKGN